MSPPYSRTVVALFFGLKPPCLALSFHRLMIPSANLQYSDDVNILIPHLCLCVCSQTQGLDTSSSPKSPPRGHSRSMMVLNDSGHAREGDYDALEQSFREKMMDLSQVRVF
jgi:hypothetical protein